MPKIGVESSVAVTQTAIQEQINKIEYLLEGRLDDENIYRDGMRQIRVSSKKVVDLPDSTRPISGNKFFASDVEGTVFQPLIDLMDSNRSFITLTGTASILMSKDAPPPEEESMGWGALGDFAKGIGNMFTGGGDSGVSVEMNGRTYTSDEKNIKQIQEYATKQEKKRRGIFTRYITIKKPPHIQPLTWNKARSLFGIGIDSYCRDQEPDGLCITPMIMDFKHNTSSNFPELDYNVIANTPDLIEIKVALNMQAVGEGEYMALDFGIAILCEVRP